jgi:hypothetical protein
MAYYVDYVGGSDSSPDPTNINTPWKTLTKVRSSLPAQSTALLKRGVVWRDDYLQVPSGVSGHPTVVGAYGTGANPMITGSKNGETIGWTNRGSNIWRCDPGSADVGNIVVNTNGTPALCHKYYHPSDTRDYTTPKLPGGVLPSTQGAYFHNTENYTFDGTTDDLLWMYSVGDPSTFYNGIELCHDEIQNTMYGRSYVTFQGIDFYYNSDMGCTIVMGGGGSNQILELCNLRFCGGSNGRGSAVPIRDGYAIQVPNGGSYVHIRNCTFRDHWNNAISWQSSNFSYHYVHHNLFQYSPGVCEFWLNGNNMDRCYWVNNTHYMCGQGIYYDERKTFYAAPMVPLYMWTFPPETTTFSNCVEKNNIYYGDKAFFWRLKSGNTAYDLTGWDIDHNCYYPTTYNSGKPFNDSGTYRSYADWKAGICCTPTPDINSFNVDPLFIDAVNGNFMLDPDSVCVGSGEYVSGINTDTSPNIGMYETQDEEPPPPSSAPKLCPFIRV